SSAPSGMKAAVFLLLTLLVPAYHTGAQCIIDNVVDLKVQAAISSIDELHKNDASFTCKVSVLRRRHGIEFHEWP
ncbi:hypothetical protein KIL84_021171, partial [Mauremys mutica]